MTRRLRKDQVVQAARELAQDYHEPKHGEPHIVAAPMLDEWEVFCPNCGDESHVLGILGFVAHYRCRYCGMEFMRRNP